MQIIFFCFFLFDKNSKSTIDHQPVVNNDGGGFFHCFFFWGGGIWNSRVEFQVEAELVAEGFDQQRRLVVVFARLLLRKSRLRLMTSPRPSMKIESSQKEKQRGGGGGESCGRRRRHERSRWWWWWNTNTTTTKEKEPEMQGCQNDVENETCVWRNEDG